MPDEPDQPVGAMIRPPQPTPVGQAVSKSPRRSNKSNKGYRHPETGETWKLQDAFFAVATEEQKRQDVENRAEILIRIVAAKCLATAKKSLSAGASYRIRAHCGRTIDPISRSYGRRAAHPGPHPRRGVWIPAFAGMTIYLGNPSPRCAIMFSSISRPPPAKRFIQLR